jgi:hypothetical protein
VQYDGIPLADAAAADEDAPDTLYFPAGQAVHDVACSRRGKGELGAYQTLIWTLSPQHLRNDLFRRENSCTSQVIQHTMHLLDPAEMNRPVPKADAANA